MLEFLERIQKIEREIVAVAQNEIMTICTKKGFDSMSFVGLDSGIAIYDQLIYQMNQNEVAYTDMDEACLEAGIRSMLGSTFVARKKDNQKMNKHEGLFFMSMIYSLDEDEKTVYVNPKLFYFMKYNKKFHKFVQKFDDKIPFFSIEKLKASHIVNHFKQSFDFFVMFESAKENPFTTYPNN